MQRLWFLDAEVLCPHFTYPLKDVVWVTETRTWYCKVCERPTGYKQDHA